MPGVYAPAVAVRPPPRRSNKGLAARQRARDASREEVGSAMGSGWRRGELYDRGVAG